jgi:hypothetical protein
LQEIACLRLSTFVGTLDRKNKKRLRAQKKMEKDKTSGRSSSSKFIVKALHTIPVATALVD